MTTSTTTLPMLPTDVTTIARGRGQRAVLAAVHSLGPSTWRSLTEDIARHPLARGIHFASLMSACEALVKRGLLAHKLGDRGDMYRLVEHAHPA